MMHEIVGNTIIENLYMSNNIAESGGSAYFFGFPEVTLYLKNITVENSKAF